MAHSNHQRMMPRKPNTLALQQQQQNNNNNNNNSSGTMESSSRAYPNASNNYNNEYQEAWHEQPFNFDELEGSQFDLITFVGEDSPLTESAPDDMQKMKEQAQWDQFQYWELQNQCNMQHHHPQADYEVMPNDFANVPNFVGDPMEMDNHFGPNTPTQPAGQFVQQHHALDNVQLTPSTSKASANHPQPPQIGKGATVLIKQEKIVKEEPSDHEIPPQQQQPFSSTSSRASSVNSGGSIYTLAATAPPTTSSGGPLRQPRKYRVKPEHEKLNPLYRQKRCKNNEAVRKSREKAKLEQIQKESRLHELEQIVGEQEEAIAQLEGRNEQLQNEFAKLKHNCRCGAVAKLRR